MLDAIEVACDGHDAELGKLIGLGLDKVGEEARAKQWRKHTIFPRLLRLIQAGVAEDMFAHPFKLPPLCMWEVFFALVAHLLQSDASFADDSSDAQ